MTTATDLTFLRTFTSGDSAKMTKYINMFLGMAPQSLTQMRQQVDAGDWKGLKTSAHSLKTQLKYMGAAGAAELASTMEQQAGDEKDLDKMPGLMARLEEQTQLTIAELGAVLGKL